ncbi:hypothetical protein RY831_21455 [Noviherbaspirillum sp. CPCC 100848]|uniref:Uncharacterized protein n=1 Tax=Noviherbaspirillum album TaxID=3080276 RepID=A0ABU6JF77_9BURK|nr:hypothetical protein [Noviherbaspirillum sp. CPCC 100848]MEC4721739.1 hypothetical protein [Noviherbaspirillum sp. CPCC 100848]
MHGEESTARNAPRYLNYYLQDQDADAVLLINVPIVALVVKGADMNSQGFSRSCSYGKKLVDKANIAGILPSRCGTCDGLDEG